GRDPALKKQLPGKLGWNRRLAGMAPALAEHAPACAPGQLPVHGPEGKANAIPTEVSQAAVWLELALGADVRVESLLGRIETECGVDSPDAPDGMAVIQDVADQFQPPAVHEHDSIHELNAVAAASLQHLNQVAHRYGTGLLADQMLARLGGAQDPFLANARGQRNINPIDIPGREHVLVPPDGPRGSGKRGLGLALGDKLPAALRGAAGHDRNDAVLRVADGLPAFPGYLRSA